MTAPSGFTVTGPSTQALEVRIGDSWQEVLRVQFRDVGEYNIETPRSLPAEATQIRLVTYLSLEAFLALQDEAKEGWVLMAGGKDTGSRFRHI
jgi:hypothetical protein